MSLSPDQRIISADDHMDIHVLPPDLYQVRLPQALRERGPKVVDTDDGPFWWIDGQQVSPSGRKAAGFLQSDQHGYRPGTAAQRLEDLDRDGVWAQVIYSPTTTQMRSPNRNRNSRSAPPGDRNALPGTMTSTTKSPCATLTPATSGA